MTAAIELPISLFLRMRLLKFCLFERDDSNVEDIDELSVSLCDFPAQELPQYAVLSHRWGRIEDEVSFQDIIHQDKKAREKHGYRKIESCCRQALRDGLTHAWIDTCCINKESSAELSEAINSMYKWYKNSKACYVYLEDVQKSEKGKEKQGNDYSSMNSSFRNSKWFTRGWTLQELLAPKNVTFFAANWVAIGRKHQPQLARVLSEVTGIPINTLIGRSKMKDTCASQIMFWASKRQTTRIEDRAYSLLGLFDISLPIIYGEGPRAFRRLQEEIIRSTFDHTIFAWSLPEQIKYSSLLANSPDDFAQSGNIRKMPFERYSLTFDAGKGRMDYSLTNVGLEITLPYKKIYGHMSSIAVCIACVHSDTNKAVVLYLRHLDRPANHFFRTKNTEGGLYTDDKSISDFPAWNIIDNRFKVVSPERFLANNSILPMIPDKIARQDNSINAKHIKCYQVTLSCIDVTISAVNPMPHNRKGSKITLETEADRVWVATVEDGGIPVFHVSLAVINDRLKYHLEPAAYGEVDHVSTEKPNTRAPDDTAYNGEMLDAADEDDYSVRSDDSDMGDDQMYEKVTVYKSMNVKRDTTWQTLCKNPCTELYLGRNREGYLVEDKSGDELVARMEHMLSAISTDPPRIIFTVDISIRSRINHNLTNLSSKYKRNSGRTEEESTLKRVKNLGDKSGLGVFTDDINQKKNCKEVFKPRIEQDLQADIVDNLMNKLEPSFTQKVDYLCNRVDQFCEVQEQLSKNFGTEAAASSSSLSNPRDNVREHDTDDTSVTRIHASSESPGLHSSAENVYVSSHNSDNDDDDDDDDDDGWISDRTDNESQSDNEGMSFPQSTSTAEATNIDAQINSSFDTVDISSIKQTISDNFEIISDINATDNMNGENTATANGNSRPIIFRVPINGQDMLFRTYA